MTTHGIGYWYVEVEKQAFWRGNAHNWVNRYVMSGDDPTAAQAITVINQIKGIEDVIHPIIAAGEGIGFVEGRAYSKNGGAPLASVTYNTTGTAAGATGFTGVSGGGYTVNFAATLETCVLLETRLNGLSSAGKPIYLRKYYRGIQPGGPEDTSAGETMPAGYITHVNTVTVPFQTGMGANNWVVIGTSGKQAAAAPVCNPYLVNHQIPRGRKKKKATSSDVLGALSSAAGDVAHAITIAGAL